MAFGDIFNKIKENTQKFQDRINSDEFQNKFRSPFAEPAAPEPVEPDLSQVQQESRQVTGPHRDMSNEITPSSAGMPSGIGQASAPESAPAPAPAPVELASESAPESAPAEPAATPLTQPAGGQQIGNTNADVANAKPGDWIVRSNGQKVVLTQAHIDWAKNKMSQSKSGGKSEKVDTPSAKPTGGNTVDQAKLNGAAAAKGNGSSMGAPTSPANIPGYRHEVKPTISNWGQ